MHIVDTKPIECGECGSTDIEHVVYFGSKFMRCRKCKHEGTKSNVLPDISSGESVSFTRNDQPLKF